MPPKHSSFSNSRSCFGEMLLEPDKFHERSRKAALACLDCLKVDSSGLTNQSSACVFGCGQLGAPEDWISSHADAMYCANAVLSRSGYASEPFVAHAPLEWRAPASLA
jgi:hypothetical protein